MILAVFAFADPSKLVIPTRRKNMAESGEIEFRVRLAGRPGLWAARLTLLLGALAGYDRGNPVESTGNVLVVLLEMAQDCRFRWRRQKPEEDDGRN